MSLLEEKKRKRKGKLYFIYKDAMNYLHKYINVLFNNNDDNEFYTKSLLVSLIPIRSYRTLLENKRKKIS